MKAFMENNYDNLIKTFHNPGQYIFNVNNSKFIERIMKDLDVSSVMHEKKKISKDIAIIEEIKTSARGITEKINITKASLYDGIETLPQEQLLCYANLIIILRDIEKIFICEETDIDIFDDASLNDINTMMKKIYNELFDKNKILFSTMTLIITYILFLPTKCKLDLTLDELKKYLKISNASEGVFLKTMSDTLKTYLQNVYFDYFKVIEINNKKNYIKKYISSANDFLDYIKSIKKKRNC